MEDSTDTQARKSTRPVREIQTVLVVQRHHGGCDFFCELEANVRFIIVNEPRLNLASTDKKIRGELMCEEYIRNSLPASARDIFQPGNLRASSDAVFCRTPAEMLDRNEWLRVFKEIDTIRNRQWRAAS